MGWLQRFGACVLAAAGFSAALAQPTPGITAAEIVEKNAAARGGVQAWQKIQTMAWTGRAEVGSTPGRELPFLLEQKRPGKTRFEIVAEGQRSVRIFDGSAGWKMRPNASSGRPEVFPYTEDELMFARGAQVIDGPLMDYAARGAAITLAGTGELDGQRAYVLDVKLPSGGGHKVWVDTKSFLEVRHDRQVGDGRGPAGQVTVLLRDYREFEGVKVPTTVETSAEQGRPANRLVIERVAINPELDDDQFSRPARQFSQRRGVVVDTRGAAAAAPPRAP
jgi:outer membrane lipoprotein-sorting protein